MFKAVKSFVASTLTTQARRYRQNESGNVALMTAFLLIPFIGGAAVAVDMSQGYFAKQRLQDTTDAIALMAAKDGLESQAELTAAAQAFYDVQYPGSSGGRIEIVNIQRNGDTVSVEARNNIDASFGVIFGKKDVSVRVASSATYAESALDLALVLDTTGSMRGSKMASLKTAATDLIDELDSNEKVRMSVVPFAQYVNVGTSARNESWLRLRNSRSWSGCVGSRRGANGLRPEYSGTAIPSVAGSVCGEALQPMTNNLNRVKTTVNRMNASGWTYMPSGLMWGWRTLSASAPFANSSPSTTQKVMVVMTDGTNTRSKSGTTHENANTNDANNITADLCTRIKQDKIVVYSIAYDITNNQTRNLVRNFATDNAKFFNASNASDLQNAFEEIGDSIRELRVVS